MSLDTVPKDLRNLRACLFCGLIKTFNQFDTDGCENCEEFFQMRNNVYSCSSSNFDGMIAVINPEDSWVCKWQRTTRFVKGVYAISVSGKLPPEIVRELKSKGIPYRPRDVSRR